MPHSDDITTVLVVDDDPIVQAVIERVLVRGGYRVLVAGTAAEALAALAGNAKIRVVTVDQQLPDTTGAALIDAIHLTRPGVRTIGISGGGPVGAVASNADRALGKPFAPPVLLRLVAELFPRRAAPLCERIHQSSLPPG